MCCPAILSHVIILLSSSCNVIFFAFIILRIIYLLFDAAMDEVWLGGLTVGGSTLD